MKWRGTYYLHKLCFIDWNSGGKGTMFKVLDHIYMVSIDTSEQFHFAPKQFRKCQCHNNTLIMFPVLKRANWEDSKMWLNQNKDNKAKLKCFKPFQLKNLTWKLCTCILLPEKKSCCCLQLLSRQQLTM